MTRATFPRTLTEAFADADRAGSVQGPYRNHNHPVWWIGAAALVGLAWVIASTLP